MNFLFLNSARRGWGGNERSVEILTRVLSREHQVVLAYRDDIVGNRFDTGKYRLPFLFEGDLVTIARLVWIVRKHRIDVIVPTKRKDYALAGVVSRLCSTCNVLWLGATRDLGRSVLNDLVYNRLADGIVVNARGIKDALLRSPFMQANRIAVIYNGLDTESLDVEYAKPVLPSRRLCITSMGRLDENKNHDLLIRAFGRMLSMDSALPADLVIIGDGPRREALGMLADSLNLKERVRFTGFQPNPYPLLRESGIFVMTSRLEGLSIALLEAMYLGNVPVSTLAGGGVTEIVQDGENGFLVENDNEEGLASVLLRLCRNSELRGKVAALARDTVATRYSQALVARRMVEFCGEIRRERSCR